MILYLVSSNISPRRFSYLHNRGFQRFLVSKFPMKAFTTDIVSETAVYRYSPSLRSSGCNVVLLLLWSSSDNRTSQTIKAWALSSHGQKTQGILLSELRTATSWLQAPLIMLALVSLSSLRQDIVSTDFPVGQVLSLFDMLTNGSLSSDPTECLHMRVTIEHMTKSLGAVVEEMGTGFAKIGLEQVMKLCPPKLLSNIRHQGDDTAPKEYWRRRLNSQTHDQALESMYMRRWWNIFPCFGNVFAGW